MNKYKCVDIMNLKEFPIADMIWTDPPWEQKMVKYFETILHKQTGKERPNNNIDDILNKFSKLSSKDYLHKTIIIEYSKNTYQRVIDCMTNYGHKFIRVHKSIYQSPNDLDYVLLVFNKDLDMSSTLKGTKVITDALSKLPNKGVVFDCFAGIGATKKAVNKAGWKYIGYEINPKRYERLCK